MGIYEHGIHALPQEKPLQREAGVPQLRVAPAGCNYRKANTAAKTQYSHKKNKLKKFLMY